MTATAPIAEATYPSVTMDRVFAAPRDLMFKIWTEREHILRWWAPHDFTVPDAVFDATPGVRLRIDFRWPNGVVFENFGDVVEVSPPERLVFTTEYREGGRLMVSSLVTVKFEAVEALKTRVSIFAQVTHAEPEAANSLAGMEEGWNQQIDKLELLAAYLAGNKPLAVVAPVGRPVVLMRRKFAAPRDLVWSCFTQPERLAAWWGPNGSTNEITAFDLKKGGFYRVEQTDQQGNRHAFSGEYREVIPPERLVSTFAMEGQYAGDPVTNTQLFEEVEGGTQLTAITYFKSVEARDGVGAAGMEWGASQSYQRLENLMADLEGEPK